MRTAGAADATLPDLTVVNGESKHALGWMDGNQAGRMLDFRPNEQTLGLFAERNMQEAVKLAAFSPQLAAMSEQNADLSWQFRRNLRTEKYGPH